LALNGFFSIYNLLRLSNKEISSGWQKISDAATFLMERVTPKINAFYKNTTIHLK